MNSIAIAGIVFVCACAGAAIGMYLRAMLPEHHLSAESKDIVKVAMGLVASMDALVLGLLVASATSEFNTQKSGYQQLAANLLFLDRTLGRFGPEAEKARAGLRRTVAAFLDHNWPGDSSQTSGLQAAEVTAEASALYEAIQDLSPANAGQQASQSQAQQIFAELAKTRLLLSQEEDASIPRPFLIVLGFWLFVLFVSFGLFSPWNSTVIGALLVCSLSVSAAVFLIIDLDQPFEGLIQISSAPLRRTLSQLGQ
jgi:hypothetical protein